MINTYKVYRPTITFESGEEYNIRINPELRRLFIAFKNENNKIFINKQNIWDFYELCKSFKEFAMFDEIYNYHIRHNKTDIPFCVTYEENYGTAVSWD